jgi:transcriptional regulator with XRE-family HTH domain
MTIVDAISANVPLLRDLGERLGQQELAVRVGVSRRTIARLENAEVSDPGIDLVRRIADELGVTLTLLTDCRLEQVTLALPEDVSKRLRAKDRGEVLEAMVRAARAL